ncbi:MAG TPA: SDR family NAD(P)-dependent oxidoreductase [Acidimicrobiales bacterium]|jgi:meso-butanediol dehydrogenase/(S,S)-butanediol dehydrogenase/diacetyl reductase|nr:SDR family NAD(P)-dependent oxidoreductase [Acidimicrobiales bacterium]
MSPIQRVTLGQGGAEHDAANAAIGSFTGRRFVDKVAVVTGAGSGIGRAVAIRLAEEGARVAALDVAADNLAATVKDIAEEGGTAIGYPCDVTSETSVNETVAALAGEVGPPTVVCNVAGIGGFYNTVDMPTDRWERILAVNLTGPFLVCRATLPFLLEHGGSIVNVASNTALMGQAYSAAYCASKAGLLMFSKALAAEYLSRSVRVNVVAPGGVDTPLIGTFELPEGADFKELRKIMTPMGFSTPSEIAASIAFIASDESTYTTGAVLSVDGGLTI